MRVTRERRFWAKVDLNGPNGCWLWTANRTKPDGYGRFYPSGNRGVLAHRFAYELLIGPIPEGLQLDHLCRVRICVNPAHLEPVTARENCLRGYGPTAENARKTHCPRGHPLNEQRRCDICVREIKRRSQAKRMQDPAYIERRRAQDRARYWRRKESAGGR